MSNADPASHIDQLLDAIDLIHEDKREEARLILRQLIQENPNFEDAWLWMSLAVDSVDKSSVCLDNVLRINPHNVQASGALFRLREAEMRSEANRARLRSYRDFSTLSLWILTIFLLFAVLFSSLR